MKKINYCAGCDIYTLEAKCKKCNAEVHPNTPMKFSLEDKFGKYRRESKREMLKEKGLI